MASALSGLSEPEHYYKSNKLIYRFVFLMSALGKSAFLQMDQIGRFQRWRRLFRIDQFSDKRLRHCVVSDTTIVDRLRLMDHGEIAQIGYEALSAGLSQGFIQPIAIIDGSYQGGQFWSWLGFVSIYGDIFIVDNEPISGKGKELVASRRLLERFCEKMGKGVIDLLLADMLYFNEGFWQLRQDGYMKDFLVKYTPDPERKFDDAYRIVLQRFEALVELYEKPDKSKRDRLQLYHMGVRDESGYDETRRVDYQIYSADQNSWDSRFKIARVFERYVKTGEQQCFYVITTRKSLSANRMRELGHNRWYIENDGFKMLNAHVKSKRIWNKDVKVLANLTLIWALAFSLLWLFRRRYDHIIRKHFNAVKLTLQFTAEILEQESFGRMIFDSG